MTFLVGLLTLPAMAGPVNWAHQAGAVQSNGAVVVKSLGGAVYSATSNPTGLLSQINRTSSTQPPTVIIKNGLPCYVGMKKKNRERYCKLGDDVLSSAEDGDIVGKYGGSVSVKLRRDGVITDFQHDFIVALKDQLSTYSCAFDGPYVAYGDWSGLSAMSIMGFNRPVEVTAETAVLGSDYGIEMSSDFWYGMGQLRKCAVDTYNRSAVVRCATYGKGWYLPSINELSSMSRNREVLGGFSDTVYWSSMAAGTSNAYVYDFASNSSTARFRNDQYHIRCARVFNDLIQ